MRLYSSYSFLSCGSTSFTTEHDEQERTNLNKKWVTASFCAFRELCGFALKPTTEHTESTERKTLSLETGLHTKL